MKYLLKYLSVILIANYTPLFGQNYNKYSYRREIAGVANKWHVIQLPDSIFSKMQSSLGDLRIYGINKKNDTIEIPYILKKYTPKESTNKLGYKVINSSYNQKGHYYTIELNKLESINQIIPEFKQNNFDCLVKLEGSQNLLEWFTIIENYRILSIKNSLTDYTFTKLAFPTSKYRYYRITINEKSVPELKNISISQEYLSSGEIKNYESKSIKTNLNKKDKQTEIDIQLPTAVPISILRIGVKEKFDYYRPISFYYISDSIKTEKGWKYNYQTLSSGTLNSFETNEFNFNETITQRLRIIIQNQDNQPLTVNEIKVMGYKHELLARFNGSQGSYYLTYGNKNATKPQYDIEIFKDKIQDTLTTLQVGIEQQINKSKSAIVNPLFQNKNWLWIIMAITISLLGWFSFKMIQKN